MGGMNGFAPVQIPNSQNVTVGNKNGAVPVPNSTFQAQLGNQQNAGFTQQDYSGALNSSIANALSSANAQQGLISTLQNEVNGGGPNLAQAQLQQAQESNNQQAAGSIAAQTSLNPAQQARLILQNQGSNNQAAAMQSEQARMQEQLSAQQQLGQAAASLGSNSTALLGGAQAGNAQNLNNFLSAETLNQNTASQNVGADLQAEGIQNHLALQEEGQLASAAGGLLNSAGGYSSLNGAGNAYSGAAPAANTGAAVEGGYGSDIGAAAVFAHGGRVDKIKKLLVSPGEAKVPAEVAKDPKKGADYVASGKGKIPGQAKVPGDSTVNDTVPLMGKLGDVIVPKSVAEDPEATKAFLDAVKAHRRKARKVA